MEKPERIQHVGKSLPGPERSVYDFDIVRSKTEMKKVIQEINCRRYDLLGMVNLNGDIIIYFRRPAHG